MTQQTYNISLIEMKRLPMPFEGGILAKEAIQREEDIRVFEAIEIIATMNKWQSFDMLSLNICKL